jgi:aspartyl-tRNA(Asn)/glutamyl-tRNA(Gln) amidotransferase subunit B
MDGTGVTGGFEAVIGLEVHAQLATGTKLFCPCPVSSRAEPNTLVCPVCTGQPGALPSLNGRAVELALRAALALGAHPRAVSVFARKNYFYPDMPKNYQISQYSEPLAEGGELDAGSGAIRIRRIHVEEDAGKLLHAEGSRALPHSRVDLNRAGVPLAEIVTEPDLRRPEDAGEFLVRLREVLRYAGVSRCDMEKGEMRCDANVSVRRAGEEGLGAKVEVKNLNSVKAVRDALAFEALRQSGLLARGEAVPMETRLWRERLGATEAMRSKEGERDYRYFPDPDLPPLSADAALLRRAADGIPELPLARRARFEKAYGLSAYDAGVLVSEKELADYFERAAASAGPEGAKAAAHWIQSELLARLHAAGLPVEACPVPPERLGELVALIFSGTLSGKLAKEVFSVMWDRGEPPGAVVERLGMSQVRDSRAVGLWVDEAIAENPKACEDVRAGKARAAGALVGAVMRKSKGKANPELVNRLILERLGRT